MRPASVVASGRLVVVAAVVAFLTLVPLALAAPPERPHVGVPGDVQVHAGSDGTVAVLGWSPSEGASGYRIWRSIRTNLAFEPVGSTSATGFEDASGVPGRMYFYRVTAMLPSGEESSQSTTTAGVTAGWNESPHATYGKKGNLCLTCHALHRDPESDALGGEVAICESCHDGQGARSNVKDGPEDSFALASGHRVEEATRSADLTNECSSCHSPHADPLKRVGLYRTKIAGRTVAGGNEWCAACHDDANSWSPGYPSLSSPKRDSAGYPVLGTYPGPTVYADPEKSGHAGIDAGPGRPKGDCLLCHAAHRGPNAYDGLLSNFAPSSASSVATDQATGRYAQLCLGCHGGQKEWTAQGAADIQRYVTRRTAAGYEGHSVVTSGGTLPVGAPVPCYDCHDPHGSSRGNSSMISDALGRDLSTSNASGVRAFCLTCHSTSDGKVWDSDAGKYADAGESVYEGLRRDGSGGNLLHLRDESSSAHAASDGDSCYDCHGGSYSSGADYNVHAPRRAGTRTPSAVSALLPTGSDEKTSTPRAGSKD